MNYLILMLLLVTSGIAQKLPTNVHETKEKLYLTPPSKITVCGKTVMIVIVDPLKNDKSTMGQTNDHDKPATILIIKDMDSTPAEQARVLMHEIMHVINDTDRSGNEETVHEFIYDTATCLTNTLFHDNPALLQYFIAASYVKDEEQPKPPPPFVEVWK